MDRYSVVFVSETETEKEPKREMKKTKNKKPLSFLSSDARCKPESQARPRHVVGLRREHFHEVDLEVAHARGPDEAGALEFFFV